MVYSGTRLLSVYTFFPPFVKLLLQSQRRLLQLFNHSMNIIPLLKSCKFFSIPFLVFSRFGITSKDEFVTILNIN